tara:strand:+ start:441 stop:704 length:264 start_codon:yes stop_codon:yes gene_type:complete
MNDDEQTEGKNAFANMVKLMLNTDFTYVMRLIETAQLSIQEDQERDLEPFTHTALGYVERQVYESAKALQAVIDFQNEYFAQREGAD